MMDIIKQLNTVDKLDKRLKGEFFYRKKIRSSTHLYLLGRTMALMAMPQVLLEQSLGKQEHFEGDLKFIDAVIRWFRIGGPRRELFDRRNPRRFNRDGRIALL